MLWFSSHGNKNSVVRLHPVIITLNIYSKCVYYKITNVDNNIYVIQSLSKNFDPAWVRANWNHLTIKRSWQIMWNLWLNLPKNSLTCRKNFFADFFTWWVNPVIYATACSSKSKSKDRSFSPLRITQIALWQSQLLSSYLFLFDNIFLQH